MNSFVTSYESHACACGGRHNEVPSIKTKHEATLRHRRWRWERLCEAMLTEGLTRADKVQLLRESRAVLTATEPRQSPKTSSR